MATPASTSSSSRGLLFLLSPAKALNMTVGPADLARGYTQPRFQDNATQLVGVLHNKSADALKKLMGLSDSLARLNRDRYHAFRDASPEAPVEGIAKQAAFAFDGPAFRGLDAATLDKPALSYLQSNLCILSGLYGVLRPLDLIQPYRLEMGSRLAVPDTNTGTLYEYWATTPLHDTLAEKLSARPVKLIINVASTEYSKVVDRNRLPGDTVIVDCAFLDDGRIVSVYAKRARGLMARYAAQTQAQTLEDLQSFNLEGYRFSASQSGKDRLVFLRSKGSRPSENEAKDAVASSAKDEPLKTTKRGGAKGGKDKKTIVGKGPVTTTSAGKRQPTPASEHQPTRKAAKAKVNNASPALRRSARHE